MPAQHASTAAPHASMFPNERHTNSIETAYAIHVVVNIIRTKRTTQLQESPVTSGMRGMLALRLLLSGS